MKRTSKCVGNKNGHKFTPIPGSDILKCEYCPATRFFDVMKRDWVS